MAAVATDSVAPAAMAGRVCRVVPDVRAVDKAFDYLVPEAIAHDVRIGAIVRVPLHGRRVRGWVIADDVEAATTRVKLREVIGFVSCGPPADVVALSEWGAWRWAGPRTTFLRAASPPNNVRGLPASPAPRPPITAVVDPLAAELARDARASVSGSVIRWPPTADPYDLVVSLLTNDGSTIVLAPSAATAVHLARRLGRSGVRVVVMRSDDNGAARTRAWVQAAAGSAVVIGGRIAALAPVPDLAGVVVLDDADEALQEERAPTWHGRDVAHERARRAGTNFTVVSPLPTVDASVHITTHLAPNRSAERDGWPITEVVDRRREPPGLGLFSERLVAALRSTISDGRRCVCVLNRKGRARLLACDACGELVRCERCGASTAEVDGSLVCPRCGEKRPRLCVNCGATRLKTLRAGVTRVRDDLAALLAHVDVAEVDATTADIPDVSVLVGTEAVLHRVREAKLVAFLDFDRELLAPRYRAAEQALWLLIRAARVVGSRHDGGRLLVQTRVPRHEVLDAAVRADPTLVTDAEQARRNALQLPPFGALAVISGDERGLPVVREQLAAQLGLEVGGDDKQVVVRASDQQVLSNALELAMPRQRASGVRLRVEVDPARF